MQQDWESVEVGGWEDGDSLVGEEGREVGNKKRGNTGVLERKLGKRGVMSRDKSI